MVTGKSDDALPARQSAIAQHVLRIERPAWPVAVYHLRPGVTLEQRKQVLAEIRATHPDCDVSAVGDEAAAFPRYM